MSPVAERIELSCPLRHS